MPATLVQELLSGSDTSLSFSIDVSGSKTLTAGNDVVAVVCMETTVSVPLAAPTDNLGNTYTVLYSGKAGVAGVVLGVAQCHNAIGGTLTSISWGTGAFTSRGCLISFEFSEVLDGLLAGGDFTDSGNATVTGETEAGSGLHLFPVGIHRFQVGGVTPPSSLTVPSGYTLADYISTNLGANLYLGVALAYFVGFDTGSLVGTFVGGTAPDWLTPSLVVAAVAPPPAGGGVSFDGVTVRS